MTFQLDFGTVQTEWCFMLFVILYMYTIFKAVFFFSLKKVFSVVEQKNNFSFSVLYIIYMYTCIPYLLIKQSLSKQQQNNDLLQICMVVLLCDVQWFLFVVGCNLFIILKVLFLKLHKVCTISYICMLVISDFIVSCQIKNRNKIPVF